MDDYTIIETDSGPMISHSRTSVYDVLELYRDGDSVYEICGVYNLKPLQVEIAIAYINQNRAVLDAELDVILVEKAEREQYYRKIEEERRAIARSKPMTPERKRFYEILDQRRALRKSYGLENQRSRL